MSNSVILLTNASSGFGLMTAQALARADTPSTPSCARRRAGIRGASSSWVPGRRSTQGGDGRAGRFLRSRVDGVERGDHHPGVGCLHERHQPLRPFRLARDVACAAEYTEDPYPGVADQALKGLAALERSAADPAAVADAIVNVVANPFGRRSFRVHGPFAARSRDRQRCGRSPPPRDVPQHRSQRSARRISTAHTGRRCGTEFAFQVTGDPHDCDERCWADVFKRRAPDDRMRSGAQPIRLHLSSGLAKSHQWVLSHRNHPAR